MSQRTAFMQVCDGAWEHRWESLLPVLEGVTEEEASWQAPCYAAGEREEGWPAPGTIWWQVAHISHCKRYYTRLVRAPGVTERPDAEPYVPVDSFAAEVERLTEVHAAQRAAIAALEEQHFAMRVGNGMTMTEFLASTLRHDTWHASQIAVARRLYRTRP